VLGVFGCGGVSLYPRYAILYHKGWQAMDYKGAPWYFEFVIVGIAVSKLGLMRLFRAFWGVGKGSKARVRS